MAPIILQPTLALENKDEMLIAHKRDLLKAGIIKEEEKKSDALIHAKNVVHIDDQQTMM